MKRIVSVSIGASSRNHRVTMNICGQVYHREDRDRRKYRKGYQPYKGAGWQS